MNSRSTVSPGKNAPAGDTKGIEAFDADHSPGVATTAPALAGNRFAPKPAS